MSVRSEIGGAEAVRAEIVPSADPLPKRICILVLGMHRSGTSALTQVLSLAGARLPIAQAGAGASTATALSLPTSKPTRLSAFHDTFLAGLGSRWEDWRRFDPRRMPEQQREAFKAEVKQHLRAEFGEAALIVVEAPRICRFAPLFLAALDEADVDTRIVLPIRNPLEVAGSSGERTASCAPDQPEPDSPEQDLSKIEATLLWLRWVLDAEAATRGRPRAIVSDDAVRSDWRGLLETLAERLHVQWPSPIVEIAPEVDRLLAPGQPRPIHTVEDVQRDLASHHWTAEVLEALLVLERNPASQPALSSLDRVRREFDRAAPVMNALLDQTRSRQMVEVDGLKATLRERTAEATRLATELARTQAKAVEIAAALAQRSADSSRHESAAESHASRVAELSTALAENEAKAVTATAGLAHSTEEARRHQAELAERRAEVERLVATLASSKARFDKQTRALAGIEAKLAETTTDLAARDRRYIAERGKLTAEVERLTREGSELVTDLANMRRSTSWRIMHPVRAVIIRTRQLTQVTRLLPGIFKYSGSPVAAAKRTARVLRAEGIAGVRHRLRYFAQHRTSMLETSQRRAVTAPAEFEPSAELKPAAQLARLRGRENVAPSLLPSFQALSANRNRPIPDDPGILRDQSKLIAFYLPQYHPVKENSEWWGPGFTEWTNVAKARPNFDGHYQPHIPRELGFYDLSNVDVMREQARLARTYGVHGFCFYHYWFSGRRILERPADNFLASDIDLPFCLCWANENWTRTWSGDTKSVLLKQDYGHGEEERFIRDLLPYLRDRRYIRVDGKPLLLIYRIKELPEPAASIQKWRQEAARAGLPGLHIAVVDFYDISVPREVGADALVEFPPHKFNGPDNHPSPIPVFRNPEFAGGLLSYRKIIEQSLAKESPDFELYRGIIPNWDNTPRRQNTSSIIVSANPDSFGAWLRYLRTYNRLVRPTDDRSLLFVNAWNEWGEGCHLEPDLRFGLQYLEQVARTSWFDAANAPVSLGEARAQARDALQVADAALAIR